MVADSEAQQNSVPALQISAPSMSPSCSALSVNAIYDSKSLRALVDDLLPAAIHEHILALPKHSSSVGPASDRHVLRESFVLGLAESARVMSHVALREAVVGMVSDTRRRNAAEAEGTGERCAALLASLHLSGAAQAGQDADEGGSAGACAAEQSRNSGAARAVLSSGAYLRDTMHSARERIPAFGSAQLQQQQDQQQKQQQQQRQQQQHNEEHDVIVAEHSDAEDLEHLVSISQRERSEELGTRRTRGWAGGFKFWGARSRGTEALEEASADAAHHDDALSSSSSSDGAAAAQRASRKSRRHSGNSFGSSNSHSSASTGASDVSGAHARRSRGHSSSHHRHQSRAQALRRNHSSGSLHLHAHRHSSSSNGHHRSHHRSHHHSSRRHHSERSTPMHVPVHSVSLWKSVSVDNLVGLFRRKRNSCSDAGSAAAAPHIKSILKPCCRLSSSAHAASTSIRSEPGTSGRSGRLRRLLPFASKASSPAPEEPAVAPPSCDKHVRFGTCRMISQTGEVVGCMQLCAGEGAPSSDEEDEEEEEGEAVNELSAFARPQAVAPPAALIMT